MIYHVYNRLITDFKTLMSEEERLDLIEDGRQLFIPEVTEHWD